MSTFNQRRFLGAAALAAAGTAAAGQGENTGRANELKIRDVRAIITRPLGLHWIVVKVETNEPGLYGLGCSTFSYQPVAVASVVNDYLKEFLVGKNPADIEDIWQSCYASSYWRNGPVMNNALSGLDQALWDIKGKVAGMPVYDLFGGRARDAVPVYVVPSSRSLKATEDSIRELRAQSYYYMKLALPRDVPKECSPAIGTSKIALHNSKLGVQEHDEGSIYEPRPYFRRVLDLFEHVRSTIGREVELVYDVHERLPPIDGVGFAKDVEQYKPYFIEDLFAPEDNEYFRMVRQQSSTPMAMGELYNNPHEFIPLIKDRLIDFIRVHISQIGGLTPARKLAILCETFGVRTAWHGPGDVSPVGHAAHMHLNMNAWNLGVQEADPLRHMPDLVKEMFPGIPVPSEGYLRPNGLPGLGIDFDEKLAAKYPVGDFAHHVPKFANVRRADGTIQRP